MALGYTIKKGIFILNDEGKYDENITEKFSNDSNVMSGDYQRIRTLSEKANDMLIKKKKKQEAKRNKNAEVYREIKDGAVNFTKGKKHTIDYSQAIGRKDYVGVINREPVFTNKQVDYSVAKGRKDFVGIVNPNLTTRKVDYSVAKGYTDFVGQINKDKPQNKPVEDTIDIVFELHKEVVVDYGVYNLKELIDYTLNILDNILNSSSIPGPLKSAVNTSLKALVGVLSITSIGKWITFLTSLQKILGLVVNCSESVGKFVERLEGLSKVSENSYKDSETISKIYSNAFGDLSKNSINHKVGCTNANYTVENILNSL